MRKLSLAVVVTAMLTCSLSVGRVVLADEPAASAKARTSGSIKPGLGNGPSEEKSLPSSAPAATTSRTTGASDQGKTVKTMNSSENAKVEAQGK